MGSTCSSVGVMCSYLHTDSALCFAAGSVTQPLRMLTWVPEYLGSTSLALGHVDALRQDVLIAWPLVQHPALPRYVRDSLHFASGTGEAQASRRMRGW
jgi:hypothetical protein